MGNTLSKRERLSSKTGIDSLISRGKFRSAEGIRYCFLEGNGEEINRILISVPKKLFKRAVKRNLLKRRIREAYRTQKGILTKSGVDILFIYSSKEIFSYEVIKEKVKNILMTINS